MKTKQPQHSPEDCGPLVEVRQAVKDLTDKATRIDVLEAAVLSISQSTATLVEANKWLQRAVLGIYGLLGSLLFGGAALALWR